LRLWVFGGESSTSVFSGSRPRFYWEGAEEADVVRRLGQDARLALKAVWRPRLASRRRTCPGTGTRSRAGEEHHRRKRGQSCARRADCPLSMILSARGSASRGNSHLSTRTNSPSGSTQFRTMYCPNTVHWRDTDVLDSIGTALASLTRRIVSWR
jgi:hypothetical protein